MPLTFGFDLGTKTGFALHDGDKLSVVSSINFKSKTHADLWARVFRSFSELILARSEQDLVVYEEVRRHLGTDAAHLYGGFLAMLNLASKQNGVRCVGVPVGTLKKFATGKGNATKDEMISACMVKLARNPKDDNAADAAWLAEYGAKILRRQDGSIIKQVS